MELNIVHLYPDLMSLYGEYANVAVFRRYLEALGAAVTVKAVTCDDEPELSGADLIYMGAGTERGQKYALERLRPHAGALKAATRAGAVVLFTGNAMELLGRSISNGRETWPGLGLADFTTAETDRRDPVDVIAHSPLLKRPVVGFMNKCSVTSGVTAALFDRLELGFGNETRNGPEGFTRGNVLATHITGPVLVKNPELTGLVLRRLFEAKGWELPDALPILPHQREAYEVTLRELSARVK